MAGPAALRVALDLMHVPSRVRHTRAAPLPEGVGFLLRIAAGDTTAESEAVAQVCRPVDEIRGAAAFFIEQVLLAPDSDSYRVLGASAQASTAELRHNMALLMRWLHPDSNGEGQHGLFAGRVTSAWDDLKTADRRLAYDRRLSELDASRPSRNSRARSSSAKSGRRRKHMPAAHGYEARAVDVYRGRPAGFIRRALWLLLGRPQH
ncbi:MAG: J domain-containing protein [Hyphomicrobiaceae bacterium]|nr:J domain-containing protein [Hyphomicrobiaceae bacterium]